MMYIGETARSINEWVKDAGRGTKSILVKHANGISHSTVEIDNFVILNEGCHNTYKRKISLAFFI